MAVTPRGFARENLASSWQEDGSIVVAGYISNARVGDKFIQTGLRTVFFIFGAPDN